MDQVDNEPPTIEREPVKLTDAGSLLNPLPGTIVDGRIEILEKLGSGGQSSVFKARHIELDRVVALKVIHPGALQTRALDRFRHEAKTAMSFNHPNIAAIRDFGQDASGIPYLVMDYVEGQTLKAYLEQRGSLPEGEAVDLTLQICDALEHVHTKGVLHRDIKPENIMLEKNADGGNVVRLVDFGLAKLFVPGAEEGTNLTQTGEVFGTPDYMSPEQAFGHKLDRRSDIYSVGCLLYELLTGRVPFVETNTLAVLMCHLHEQPVAPRSRKADVSKDVSDLVLTCIAKEPEGRFQSVDELVTDLRKIQQGLPVNRKQRKGPKGSLRKKLIGATILVLLAFAAVTVYDFKSAFDRASAPKAAWEQAVIRAGQERTVGNFDSARAVLNKALAAAQAHKGSPLEFESIYIELGRTCTLAEDADGAIKYFAKALEYNSKRPESFETGSIHDWWSSVLIDKKDFAGALTHAKKAVEVKDRVIGPEHPLTLPAIFHLGQALRQTSHLDEAIEVDKRALALSLKLYPDQTNTAVADAHYQLANALADKGLGEEAIKNYKASLAACEKSRGVDSPVFKSNAKFVYGFLKDSGLAGEAESLKRRYSL